MFLTNNVFLLSAPRWRMNVSKRERQPLKDRLLADKELETKIQMLRGVILATIAEVAMLEREKEQAALDKALSL